MSEQEAPLLSAHFFRVFLDTLNAEIGQDKLIAVLEKAKLPADLANPQAASRYSGQSAAETYARIQKALRVYYGRGARGTLTRIGRRLWPRLLESASLPEKAQAQFIRAMPPAMRRKAALELLARLFSAKPGGATIHTLDMDFMLVDHASAATFGQGEASPVCSVTLGLIQEALFWASGREHDIDEVSCRAAGGNACEFKIKMEGK